MPGTLGTGTLGTGTFGDMGCHILDPVFGSMELTAPTSVRSEGGEPNEDSWGLDSQVRYVFPVDASNVDYHPTHSKYPATDLFVDCGERFVATQRQHL